MSSSPGNNAEIIIPNGDLVFGEIRLCVTPDRVLFVKKMTICFTSDGSECLDKFLQNITPQFPNERFQTNKDAILKDSASPREELSWLYYDMVWYVQTLCRNLILKNSMRHESPLKNEISKEICHFICECMNADLVSFLSAQSCASVTDLNKFFISRWSDYELIANSAIATTIFTVAHGTDRFLDYQRQTHNYEPESLTVSVDPRAPASTKSQLARELKAWRELTQPNVEQSTRSLKWKDKDVQKGLVNTINIFDACREKSRSFDKVNLENKENYIDACIAGLEAYQYKFKFFGVGFWRRQHCAEAGIAIESLKGIDDEGGIERAQKILNTFKQQISLKKGYNPEGHSLAIHGLYAKGVSLLNKEKPASQPTVASSCH